MSTRRAWFMKLLPDGTKAFFAWDDETEKYVAITEDEYKAVFNVPSPSSGLEAKANPVLPNGEDGVPTPDDSAAVPG